MIPQPGTKWMRKGDELVRQSVEILEISEMQITRMFVFIAARDLESRVPTSFVWNKTRDWAGEWDRL